jgi:hypothetical protein
MIFMAFKTTGFVMQTISLSIKTTVIAAQTMIMVIEQKAYVAELYALHSEQGTLQFSF